MQNFFNNQQGHPINKQLFENWRRWGSELDDTEFANAFLGLGLVAGTSCWASQTKSVADILRKRELTALERTCFLIPSAEIAMSLLISDSLKDTNDSPCLLWRFPDLHLTSEPAGDLALSAMLPQEWAESVRTIRDMHADCLATFRLRVIEFPESEPAGPCLQTLMLTNPPLGGVSMILNLNAGQTERATASIPPQFAFDWPFRLGALPGSDAQETFEYLQKAWPSSGLTRIVPLDRSNANCDLLLHRGDAAALLKKLQTQPFPCKANVVVIANGSDTDPSTRRSTMRRIAALTQASGALLLDTQEPLAVGDALNQFMIELSHNLSFDQAWTEALRKRRLRADNIRESIEAELLLTDELASFRLSKLAENLKQRAENLPPNAKLDLSSLKPHWLSVTPAQFEISHPVRGPATVAWAEAQALNLQLDQLAYHREGDGASELAAFAKAIKTAQEPSTVQIERAQRYLQQQSWLLRPNNDGYDSAAGGYILGRMAQVRIRIGPPEQAWQSLPQVFPVEELPRQSRWRLTVVLSEPNQIGATLSANITLPRDGASTTCHFDFLPKHEGAFEGCVTVLHRGRVLQTAMLRAEVVADENKANPEAAPKFDDVAVIRHHLGDLDQRSQFDMAIVETPANSAAGFQAQAFAASQTKTPATHRAGLMNIQECLEVAKRINTKLSWVAQSVLDYQDGLEGEAGNRLIRELALEGATLFLMLFSGYLEETGGAPELAKQEYLQIVTNQTDKTIPYEIIYEHEVPDDDAKTCAHWRGCLTAGKLADGCQGGTAKAVCPLGFWGLSKVIERHKAKARTDDDAVGVFLQSEPRREMDELKLSGHALFASSSRVSEEKRKEVESGLNKWLGNAPSIAQDWNDWVQIVADTGPRLIIALPHIEGNGASVTLEINDQTIRAIQIKKAHLLQNLPSASPPLVALLGCDVAGTGNDYGEPVLVFRTKGAAVVIGTIATVYTENSARVASLLVKELLSKATQPESLGAVIREVKRQGLLQNLMMSLCLVAYGDADWKLVRGPS
ncbi:MAG: hypothetical protein DM484_27040 [Candidatus Methylumidiphilus alinenensis]|uniref:CHAT domain-containing protein n=1 Tax=Candidatus Methylumidiphilus alinenensis TaxID=2202197 RepID=A0A2W4QFV1_9GAMM|nr:MAG: hypothetical protein DM484_27040 [Candidatus Methylumidiphilus alinenensis]